MDPMVALSVKSGARPTGPENVVTPENLVTR